MTVTTEVLDVGDEPINLTQALKLANLVESGGQAKMLIAEGRVRVNGEVETRKRRQLSSGDLIEVEGLPPLRVGPGPSR
jgi:ribosome-associated protein